MGRDEMRAMLEEYTRQQNVLKARLEHLRATAQTREDHLHVQSIERLLSNISYARNMIENGLHGR